MVDFSITGGPGYIWDPITRKYVPETDTGRWDWKTRTRAGTTTPPPGTPAGTTTHPPVKPLTPAGSPLAADQSVLSLGAAGFDPLSELPQFKTMISRAGRPPGGGRTLITSGGPRKPRPSLPTPHDIR